MGTINWKKFGIDIPSGKRNGHIKVRCPMCDNIRSDKKDKSLSCNLSTGEFKCHYCGWSGVAIEHSEDEKNDWMKQQPWYNERPIRKEKPTYKRPLPKTSVELSKRLLEWFSGRGISKDTLLALKVTEGKEYMPQKEAEVNTVQFNYYKDGELVNTKFRTGDKCFKLCSGAELVPYNIDAIKDSSECIITEGEIDAMSFYECGRKEVVSVPNGANSNLTYLDDFIESHFDNKTTIYIAADTDTKGLLLRNELIRRFGAEKCKIVEYGEGCKDANEHLIKFGKASLLQCLYDAKDIKVEGVFSVSDFEESLDAIFEHGMQRGLLIGHENLDKLISFETKRLCVVTGIPGSGKSEFIDEIAERMNIQYGWRFAYFSPENAPLAYHASKLIEKFTGRKFSSSNLSSDEYREVKLHLENNFFFIYPNEDFKVESILDRAKYLVRKRGIKSLVIDPYNRLENEQGSRSETQYISKLLDRLTNFAQQNDVLIILMAHPTKMQRKPDGTIEVPTLYDISGSAHFYNKCDYGIIVHRDRINEKVIVKIAKVKFRHIGEVGQAEFKYNYNNGRYTPYYEGLTPKYDNTNHLSGGIAGYYEQTSEQNTASIEYEDDNEEYLPF